VLFVDRSLLDSALINIVEVEAFVAPERGPICIVSGLPITHPSDLRNLDDFSNAFPFEKSSRAFGVQAGGSAR
jgi:hypothetical protein